MWENLNCPIYCLSSIKCSRQFSPSLSSCIWPSGWKLLGPLLDTSCLDWRIQLLSWPKMSSEGHLFDITRRLRKGETLTNWAELFWMAAREASLEVLYHQYKPPAIFKCITEVWHVLHFAAEFCNIFMFHNVWLLLWSLPKKVSSFSKC